LLKFLFTILLLFCALCRSPVYPDRRGELTSQNPRVLPQTKTKTTIATTIFPHTVPDPGSRTQLEQLEAFVNVMLEAELTVPFTESPLLEATRTSPTSPVLGMRVPTTQYKKHYVNENALENVALGTDVEMLLDQKYSKVVKEFRVYAMAIHECARQIWGQSQSRAQLLTTLNDRSSILFDALATAHVPVMKHRARFLAETHQKELRAAKFALTQERLERANEKRDYESYIDEMESQHASDQGEWEEVRRGLEKQFGKFKENEHLKLVQDELRQQVISLRARCEILEGKELGKNEETR
jgi:hypothetical protein